jgi:hypothetical protein
MPLFGEKVNLVLIARTPCGPLLMLLSSRCVPVVTKDMRSSESLADELPGVRAMKRDL